MLSRRPPCGVENLAQSLSRLVRSRDNLACTELTFDEVGLLKEIYRDISLKP